MTIPLYELPSLLHAWHKRFTLLRPETPCLIAPWLPFVLALCLCVVVFALARQARTLLWAPVCGLIGTAALLLAALVCPAVYFPLTYPEEERYQNGSYDSSGAWTALTLTEPPEIFAAPATDSPSEQDGGRYRCRTRIFCKHKQR